MAVYMAVDLLPKKTSIHNTHIGVIHMTINGLLTCSARELALPHVITDEPVVHLPDRPELANVTSINFSHMRAQVMIIVDPTRVGIGVSIYGDPKVADEVKICSRGGHAVLGDLNKNRGAYGESCEILLVITVPSRISLSTADLSGRIGLGGALANTVLIETSDNVEFYTECVEHFRARARDNSVVEVGTVTNHMAVTLFNQSKLSAQRAYGEINLIAEGEGSCSISDGFASGAFVSTGSSLVTYGGIIAGNARIEQHGSGQVSLYEVRTDCVPKITGSGTVSFNGKIYRNK